MLRINTTFTIFPILCSAKYLLSKEMCQISIAALCSRRARRAVVGLIIVNRIFLRCAVYVLTFVVIFNASLSDDVIKIFVSNIIQRYFIYSANDLYRSNVHSYKKQYFSIVFTVYLHLLWIV